MKLRQKWIAAIAVTMMVNTVAASGPWDARLPAPTLVTAIVQDAETTTGKGEEPQLRPINSGKEDLPASISKPSGVLALAPAGKRVLPALPTRSQGRCLCPDIRCTGPHYSSCLPQIYYGTNPRGDDPFLPLYQTINDNRTQHWYDAALRMVQRKKHLSEIVD
ncbi:hypothetical protein LOC67_12460 [Stieleria sp. JC731]|uniref:hypothetical protein n=1 Tax=Pirellulaceae TaxID=2691357 RepID=UPI001E3F577A|nr:hypothetical protein [Stieleria sp. JC731]MCC9601360.1 hypothetical protein [Stieleria sp. JC731]